MWEKMALKTLDVMQQRQWFSKDGRWKTWALGYPSLLPGGSLRATARGGDTQAWPCGHPGWKRQRWASSQTGAGAAGGAEVSLEGALRGPEDHEQSAQRSSASACALGDPWGWRQSHLRGFEEWHHTSHGAGRGHRLGPQFGFWEGSSSDAGKHYL